jgi:hypothetical protein
MKYFVEDFLYFKYLSVMSKKATLEINRIDEDGEPAGSIGVLETVKLYNKNVDFFAQMENLFGFPYDY